MPESVISAVRDTVAKRSPELPESATWVLTADLMDAGNWHGLATRALRKAESISPAAARAPAVQHLAGLVAARSGEARVFTSAPTPAADPNALERTQPFADSSVASSSDALAALMQKVPALKGQGLSLQGDLQRGRGQTDAAHKTYSQIAAIRMTPSIASRIQTVTPGAKVGTGPARTKKPLSPAAAAAVTKKNPM